MSYVTPTVKVCLVSDLRQTPTWYQHNKVSWNAFHFLKLLCVYVSISYPVSVSSPVLYKKWIKISVLLIFSTQIIHMIMMSKNEGLLTMKVMIEPKPTARNRPRWESAMKAPIRGMKLVVATDKRSIWLALDKWRL